MFFNQENLTEDQFLQNFWQKQPLLLRQALPGFDPPLDVNDVAGLACEQMAEARLITGSYEHRDWTLQHGPFAEDELTTLPERNWTLLVQDVEKHHPPLAALLAAFDFLPRWRIDDLMVSVAAPGGSVGPHVDQYDVFLLQAAGRRRWEIARHYVPDLLEHTELNVLRRFSREKEWILEPGDMLYLPPGIAHHGIALEDPALCMTWSIGTRAPSTADLLQGLGEWLAESRGEGDRYRDPMPFRRVRAGEIDARVVRAMRELLRAQIEDNGQFSAFLGTFLSRYRLAHEPAPPPSPVDWNAIERKFGEGARLTHNPWTRLAWLDSPPGALLFAAGNSYSCSRKLAATICDSERLRQATLPQLGDDPGLLCELVNRGHLVFDGL